MHRSSRGGDDKKDEDDEDSGQQRRQSQRQRFGSCRVCRGRVAQADQFNCAECGACVHHRCADAGAWTALDDGGGSVSWLCPVCGPDSDSESSDDETDDDDENECVSNQLEGGELAVAVAAAPAALVAATAVALTGAVAYQAPVSLLQTAIEATKAAAVAAGQANSQATIAVKAADDAFSIAATSTSMISAVIGAALHTLSGATADSIVGIANGAADARARATAAAEAAESAAATAASASTTAASAVGEAVKTFCREAAEQEASGGKRPLPSASSSSATDEEELESAKRARLSAPDDCEPVPEAVQCPICCQPVEPCGRTRPEACEHIFCFDCLTRWRRGSNSCPLDRIPFDAVLVSIWPGQPLVRLPMLPLTQQQQLRQQQQQQQLNEANALDYVCAACRVAHRPGPEFEYLLVCDHCEVAYHYQCLSQEQQQQLDDSLEDEQPWYCSDCELHLN